MVVNCQCKHGRPQDFFTGRQIHRPGALFSSKKLTTFLVVALKTQVLMHKTLYNISRGEGKCSPCPCLRAPMTASSVTFLYANFESPPQML